MATYYEYKENEDIGKSMIDWAGLTSTISENLIKEKNRRVELKSKIESNHFKQLNELNKYEQGLDPTFNSKMLEYAQNYKSYLLENHKLMKNGIISVNDAKMIKQNASDTFSNMNLAAKTYNENIKVIMDKGGNINDFLATKAAEVFDLKNKKLFINSDGIGSLGGVLKDGSIDPNTLVPMTAVNNMVQDSYEYFDMADTVAKATKNAEVWKIAISSTETIEDVRKNPEFDKWKKGTIDGILNSPNKIVAAAGNYLGLTPTTDKKLVEAEPDKYFSVEMVNGKAVFDVDSVEERVRDAVSNELEISLGRKETKQYVAPRGGGSNKNSKANLRLLADFLSTGKSNKATALMNATGISDIRIDNNNFMTFVNESTGVTSAPVKLDDTSFVSILEGLAGPLGISTSEIPALANEFKDLKTSTVFEPITGKKIPTKVTEVDYKPIATPANSRALNRALIAEEGEEADVVSSNVQAELSSILSGTGSDVAVDASGNVFLNETKVGNINEGASKILEAIDKKANTGLTTSGLYEKNGG